MDTVTIKRKNKRNYTEFAPKSLFWIKLIFFDKLRKFLLRRVKWRFLFVEISPVVI